MKHICVQLEYTLLAIPWMRHQQPHQSQKGCQDDHIRQTENPPISLLPASLRQRCSLSHCSSILQFSGDTSKNMFDLSSSAMVELNISNYLITDPMYV